MLPHVVPRLVHGIHRWLVQDPDLEWEFIDGSIVRANQHSTGAAGKENQAIGKSVGSNTTKMHMAVDACGLPIEFELRGCEVHDSKAAPALIEKLPVSEYMIADKGIRRFVPDITIDGSRGQAAGRRGMRAIVNTP